MPAEASSCLKYASSNKAFLTADFAALFTPFALNIFQKKTGKG